MIKIVKKSQEKLKMFIDNEKKQLFIQISSDLPLGPDVQ